MHRFGILNSWLFLAGTLRLDPDLATEKTFPGARRNLIYSLLAMVSHCRGTRQVDKAYHLDETYTKSYTPQ